MLKCLISKLKNRNINTDAVTAKISELEMAFKEIFDSMLKKTPKKTQDKLWHLHCNMTEANPEPAKIRFL